VDPLAEKYFEWSPYHYCFNNPIGLFDPDGQEPFTLTAIALKMLIGAGIGAVTDFSAQMTINMAVNNQNFWDAASNTDWTSVGASAITGAVGVPGVNILSKTAKVATIATAITVDASVDITASRGTATVLTGEKSLGSAVIDATGSIFGSKASDGIIDGAKNAISKDIQSGTFSTLTSSEKNTLRQANSIVNSEGAQAGVKTITGIGAEGGKQTAKTLTESGGTKISAPSVDNLYFPPADATRTVLPYYPLPK